jgi:membrane protein
VALALVGWTLLGAVMAFGLLVLGPPLSEAVGDAIGSPAAGRWIWFTAQWPILIGVLLWSLGAILRLGPAGRHRDRRALMAGAGVATVIWLAASGLFAVYVSQFGNYGAAWGSLSAVIVMLTWLWLSSLAILLGAQVAAEIERRRAVAEPLVREA